MSYVASSIAKGTRILGMAVVFMGASLWAAHKDHHVVLISIDGFPADLWRRMDSPTPNLKRLAEAGASTKAMTVVNPSLTWPNHTSIITGATPAKHEVLFNGLLVRNGPKVPPRVTPDVDKVDLVKAETLYDAAHAAGLTTAESNWVAIRHAPTITWSFPEFPTGKEQVIREMLADGSLSPKELEGLEWGQPTNLPWHDGIWLRGAQYIAQQYKPNLLLYHILTTDSTHHTFGPGNVASFAALGFADRLVGELIQTYEKLGLMDRTTFIVTTDHGFKKVTHFAYPNVTLRKTGLLDVAGPRIVKSDASAVGGGGVAMVYITDPARREELKPRVRELLLASEGVAEVIDGSLGRSLGMPTPDSSERMGDFIIYPKENYCFRDSAVGELAAAPAQNYAGTHGYRADDPDLDGIFIIAGPGIKAGMVLDRMSNLDIAPTAARLLGISLKDAEGRVLEEVIQK